MFNISTQIFLSLDDLEIWRMCRECVFPLMFLRVEKSPGEAKQSPGQLFIMYFFSPCYFCSVLLLTLPSSLSHTFRVKAVAFQSFFEENPDSLLRMVQVMILVRIHVHDITLPYRV